MKKLLIALAASSAVVTSAFAVPVAMPASATSATQGRAATPADVPPSIPPHGQTTVLNDVPPSIPPHAAQPR
jgi:hypothetical protein